MRRVVAWLAGGLVVGLIGLGAAVVLAPLPPSPPGPEPGRSLFHAHCATCHGADGRGDSWRARLLLLRPGNLAAPEMAAVPDQYLADIIRHGGATFGKPGMPSFGFTLSDAEIQALIAYLRTLPPRAASYNSPSPWPSSKSARSPSDSAASARSPTSPSRSSPVASRD